MNPVQQRLDQVTLGDPIVYGQMALFPLIDSQQSHAGYTVMDDALRDGCAEVTEVSDSGSVPELSFKNGCDQRVFLMEGEELVGAKQNRTLNISILVPAGEEIKIPVTCVESGRWAYDSPAFRRSERAHFSKGRRSKMASVSMSMRVEERPHADQSEVWSRISEKASKMKSHSRTSAMSDIFEDNKDKVEEYVSAFTTVENQSGMLVMVGDDIIGLDLFDSSDTLQKLMPKLVRSYALDAIEIRTKKPYQPKQCDAEELLKKTAAANTTTHLGIGDGENIRIQSEEVVGGALIVDGQVIHLSVFRNDENMQSGANPHDRASRVRRASRRRSSRHYHSYSDDNPGGMEDYLDIPSFLRMGRRDQEEDQ